jgi:hypothetical protein
MEWIKRNALAGVLFCYFSEWRTWLQRLFLPQRRIPIQASLKKKPWACMPEMKFNCISFPGIGGTIHHHLRFDNDAAN